MKIMVCYDGSNTSKKALELGLRYAKAFKAQVIATTALEGDPDKQLDNLEKGEQVLQYARNFISIDNLGCETKMLPANNLSVGENIVEFARQERIDKIVIGVERKSKVGKFFFGSTAQHIILFAPCEVIAAK
jgi:nucleotide-binding universal stress UspA family protein